jgi:hypothetical protein
MIVRATTKGQETRQPAAELRRFWIAAALTLPLAAQC